LATGSPTAQTTPKDGASSARSKEQLTQEELAMSQGGEKTKTPQERTTGREKQKCPRKLHTKIANPRWTLGEREEGGGQGRSADLSKKRRPS